MVRPAPKTRDDPEAEFSRCLPAGGPRQDFMRKSPRTGNVLWQYGKTNEVSTQDGIGTRESK